MITTSMQKANIIDMNYERYVEYLRNRGYNNEQICIDETYTDIVTTRNLAKGASGVVIDIRCPPMYKMVVIGGSQLSKEYDIETVSSLTMRLANSEDREIDPDTRIRIHKEKISEAMYIIDTMFYKDVSSNEYTKFNQLKLVNYTKTSTGKKPLDERYIFGTGVEINGGEHLDISVMQPNIAIDCNNVMLSLNLDLWEQEI